MTKPPNPFRVVSPEEKLPENIYEARINQIFEQCKAACPVTVTMTWETADGALHVRSIPDSYSLQQGNAKRLFDMYFGETEEVD